MTDTSTEAVELTVQRMAAIPLGMSLIEWNDLSNQILNLAAERDAAVARADALEAAMKEARAMLEGEPEYHFQGMGCGLEDRCITDRYEAMRFGWEQAMERVYGEHINDAKEICDAALTPPASQEPKA
ncbi:MAG: hypothetical protein Tp176DCM1853251_22 [Prokaryotic dsDNA virus sp.]|nr:MAG: hypothetical protein Tp176DCM1853251_22 [Prokaryotic dsDNA virus sp.]|tara:strand:- start:5095 stop:5478 length:384 start_codon:yes stop_codon:yes gene_type:complete